jgi:hypothetical protein
MAAMKVSSTQGSWRSPVFCSRACHNWQRILAYKLLRVLDPKQPQIRSHGHADIGQLL